MKKKQFKMNLLKLKQMIGSIFLTEHQQRAGEPITEKHFLQVGWPKTAYLPLILNLGMEQDYTGGQDIIYGKEEFDNFELYVEWKIPEGGNSGIFYHLKEGIPDAWSSRYLT